MFSSNDQFSSEAYKFQQYQKFWNRIPGDIFQIPCYWYHILFYPFYLLYYFCQLHICWWFHSCCYISAFYIICFAVCVSLTVYLLRLPSLTVRYCFTVYYYITVTVCVVVDLILIILDAFYLLSNCD